MVSVPQAMRNPSRGAHYARAMRGTGCQSGRLLPVITSPVSTCPHSAGTSLTAEAISVAIRMEVASTRVGRRGCRYRDVGSKGRIRGADGVQREVTCFSISVILY